MKSIVYYVSLALVAFGLLCQSLSAQGPPKVVFFGDYITYEWASAFAANPNWINQGSPSINGGVGSTGSFQADVVNLHPAIVHILVGAYNSYFVSDESALYAFQDFLSELDAMVKEAQAANIKVILGTTPPISTNASGYVTQINAAIAAYGAVNNIPVIDYADALCRCTSLITGDFATSALMTPTAGVVPLPGDGLLPNTAGYAVMTQLAENTIATVNLKLVTGWLSDVGSGESEGGGGQINVNTVSPPDTVQFTPIGYYSDGSQHPLINTNMQDATGTWTSSNPVVMNINQQGLAWALSGGTTIIKYRSPTGVPFSEWVMHVNAPAP